MDMERERERASMHAVDFASTQNIEAKKTALEILQPSIANFSMNV